MTWWGILLVAAAGWVVFSVLLGILLFALCHREILEADATLRRAIFDASEHGLLPGRNLTPDQLTAHPDL